MLIPKSLAVTTLGMVAGNVLYALIYAQPDWSDALYKSYWQLYSLALFYLNYRLFKWGTKDEQT